MSMAAGIRTICRRWNREETSTKTSDGPEFAWDNAKAAINSFGPENAIEFRLAKQQEREARPQAMASQLPEAA